MNHFPARILVSRLRVNFFGIITGIFLSLGGLLSCGLEAFYYIDYIPQGDYGDTTASIQLPSSSSDGYGSYFTHFLVFYRIYLSADFIIPGVQLMDNSTERAMINSALNSDYNGLLSLTDITSTSVSTSNLENTFTNRKYFVLTLDGADINSVLAGQSLGKRLDIAFPPNNGEQPTMVLNGVSYILQRNKENLIDPRPNRNFLNHPDLYDAANVTTEHNADVAGNTKTNLQYTYVSMYIAAKGKSLEMPPRDIYSQPTFIGIFRLTNWS